MQVYEAMAGDHIESAVEHLIDLANSTRDSAQMEFNDVTLVANPGALPGDLVAEFHRICNERRKAYERSPEGVAAAQGHAEWQTKADAAAAEGILSFAVNPDAQTEWDKCVQVNSDPYGACTVRYAARWAHLMEVRLAGGEELPTIADTTSHEADREGVTGFMYGCAVSILAKVWKHGEQLRRWHNLKTQIRDEGERANESGGVLNPALLTINT